MRSRVTSLASFLRPTREAPASRKYLLILGAGASYGSGIPPTEVMIQEIVKEYAPHLGGSVADRFDSLWRNAPSDQRNTMLERYFVNGHPSEGYLRLAKLIQEGYFDIVFTFNFDNLLERALRQVDLADFLVIVNGDVRPDVIPRLLESAEPRVKILKLHGDLRSGIFAFSSDEVLNYHREVAQVLADYSKRNVIICGYAFRDINIVRAFSTQGGAIYYVNPAGVNDNIRGFLVNRKSLDKVIEGELGKFDEFFAALYEDLCGDGEADPYQKALAAIQAREWDRAVDLLRQVPELHPHYRDARLLLAKLARPEDLYHQGLEAIKTKDWDKAVALFEQIVIEEPYYKDSVAKLQEAKQQKELLELYEKARLALQVLEWDEALTLFREIEQGSPGYKDVSQHIARLERLENLYTSGIRAMLLGRWDEAMHLFQQVVGIEPKYKDAAAELAEANRQRVLAVPTPAVPRPALRPLLLYGLAVVTVVVLAVALYSWQQSSISAPTPVVTAISAATPTTTPLSRQVTVEVIATPGTTPTPLSAREPFTVTTGQVILLTANYPADPDEALACHWEASIADIGEPDSCATFFTFQNTPGKGFVTVSIVVQPSGLKITSNIEVHIH